MARVKCFQVPGVYMWIPSGDLMPPHFHARKAGEWSAQVFFLEGPDSMIRQIKPPNARVGGTERRTIIAAVIAHRAALLVEWETCQG